MVCAPARSIIPSLKLEDYLSVLRTGVQAMLYLTFEGQYHILGTVCSCWASTSSGEQCCLVTALGPVSQTVKSSMRNLFDHQKNRYLVR